MGANPTKFLLFISGNKHCPKMENYGPEKTPYLNTFHTVEITESRMEFARKIIKSTSKIELLGVNTNINIRNHTKVYDREEI